MPVRLTKSRARSGWTEDHRDAMGQAHDYFCAFGPRGSAEALELARACWFDLRDEFFPPFVEANPFQRPRWWWDFEAPERRQCVNGPHPFDNPERQIYVNRWKLEYPHGGGDDAYRLYMGKPGCICGPDFTQKPYPKYETEKAYLIRLDLLVGLERELLAKGEPCQA